MAERAFFGKTFWHYVLKNARLSATCQILPITGTGNEDPATPLGLPFIQAFMSGGWAVE